MEEMNWHYVLLKTWTLFVFINSQDFICVHVFKSVIESSYGSQMLWQQLINLIITEPWTFKY
jgi:hypothetical protein